MSVIGITFFSERFQNPKGLFHREVEYFHDAIEVMVGMRLSNLLSHILWQKISKFFKEQKINVRKLLTRDPVGPGPHMTPGFECRRDMP